MHHSGRCHCGKIRFQFDADPIESGLRCNCSLCVRKGATMTAFTVAPDALQIDAAPDVLGTYRFGTETATHYFCQRCGIYPFHHPASAPTHYRINIGCLDGVDAAALPFSVYDGASL
ncbi:MAG: GFA family protein [Pseudomonadota bacterium]